MNRQHIGKLIVARISLALLIVMFGTTGITATPGTASAQPVPITLTASSHKKTTKSGPYITPKVEGRDTGTWVTLKITGKTKTGKKINETKPVKVGKKPTLNSVPDRT